jgi:hypothetical protein
MCVEMLAIDDLCLMTCGVSESIAWAIVRAASAWATPCCRVIRSLVRIPKGCSIPHSAPFCHPGPTVFPFPSCKGITCSVVTGVS